MTKDDGGAAYPTFTADRVYRDDADRSGRLEHVPVGGMSLRDYFAGQALAGLLSDAESLTALRGAYGRNVTINIAAAVYEFADAMLAARTA